MKYDFTTIINRVGWDALAVDALGSGGTSPDSPREGFDAIPMWVADMNFASVPSIQRAIAERMQHPTYGYFGLRDEYFEAIINWQKTRNGVEGLTRENIGYENGVLGGVINALNVYCSRGDNVLLHSPTYVGFTHTIENNGYHIVHSPLVKDENGVWRMDYADMERKIVENRIHATVLCSPHNPCGRVWEREELECAMAIFEKHHVMVISDEIWSDLILVDRPHIPTQTVSPYAKDHTVAFYAPTKTFNLAGLIGSYHVVYNSYLHDRIRKESSLTPYNTVNLLSMYALMGAYTSEGMEWLDELRQVLAENVSFACEYIEKNFEGVSCAVPEGTYMLFVDCGEWCQKHGKTIEDVEKAAWAVGVAVQDGRRFHGPCHLRVNLALPKSRVEEAFDRLKKYVFIS